MIGAPDPLPKDAVRVNGVWHLGPVDEALSTSYHAVREREQRIHTDTVVRGLPLSGHRTQHAAEWRVRARSLKRLRKILHALGKPLQILDIGCGNGWMSAALALDGHAVIAMDAHLAELEQAAHVFAAHTVIWCLSDPRTVLFPQARFDVIAFAASLQYFPDLADLFHRVSKILAPGGRIHVVDTVLYDDPEATEQAAARSAAYYRALGVPSMAHLYHAHALIDILRLGHVDTLSMPRDLGLFGRITGLNDPFHHLAVRPHPQVVTP